MSPTVDHLTPNGAKPVPIVLGDTANNIPAQPLTNGDETKPCLSETVTVVNAKASDSSENRGTMAVEQQTQTTDDGFQADTNKRKKRKRKGFMKRGPTALTRNRGTGFEGKTFDCGFLCSEQLTMLHRLLL
jgi:hypothetical protein